MSQFYPELIYATFSSLKISECYFNDASSVNSIVLEHQVSFVITNCIFELLTNTLPGPVNS